MEYSAKTRLPLYSIGITYPSPSLHSPLWYNLHSYLFVPLGEKVKGLSNDSVFGDSCQRGENISPKQKDRTTTNFKLFETKFSVGSIFQIDIFK
jgi:hypothetical protein